MDVHPRDRRPPDWLELRDLRYFLAVAEELNFTRAAQRLHLAQQALSAAIRKLEVDLGVDLFTRTTRHVALTPAGAALVAAARHVLESAADAIDEVARAGSGRTGRLIVGFSTASGSVPKVRQIIRRFAQAAPDVDVETVEYDFSDPTAGLLTGGTQVAFVFGPLAHERLEGITVLEEPRLVALPVDHPLAGREQLMRAELGGLRWLRVPAPDSAWLRFWFRHPLDDPVAGAEIRTADEWVAAIESGRGVAFTLPSVMSNFPQTEIRVVPVVDVEPGTLLLATVRGERSPLVAAFVEQARQLLSS